MTAALRVALLGYGLAGRVFHAPLIAATPGLRLAAIVTNDPVRRGQAAAEHPQAVLMDDAAALWSRAADYEIAVVAAPNTAHVPLATAALDAGLHVVVDKPLTTDARAALALVAHAGERGRLLTVFQNRRWDGDALTVRDLLLAGRLGTVHRLESRFERWRPQPKPGSWRERSSAAEGGGLLLDLGSHLVDQALWLLGPVTAVYAELETRRPDVAAEDDAFIALRHASGARSHLWMSAVAGQIGPRFRVLGSDMSYVKYGLDVQEEQLRAGGSPADPGYGIEAESAWGRLGAGGESVPVPTARGDYAAFYRGLVAAITAGAPLPVEPADAVAALAVLDAARRSAQDGSVVTLTGAGT